MLWITIAAVVVVFSAVAYCVIVKDQENKAWLDKDEDHTNG